MNLTCRFLWCYACCLPLRVLQACWRRQVLTANSLDVFLATHRDQLKPRTSELGQWLRFDGWLEARPALSWTAGLLAALLQHDGVVKLPLLRGLRVDVEKNRAGEALI